jgi:hypothetical protein
MLVCSRAVVDRSPMISCMCSILPLQGVLVHYRRTFEHVDTCVYRLPAWSLLRPPACFYSHCKTCSAGVVPQHTCYIFIMYFRRKPSDRSAIWNLYAPMLWLFLASSILGIIAWAHYLQGLTASIATFNDNPPTPIFRSPVFKAVFQQSYPVFLVMYVLDVIFTNTYGIL